jgi:hypothetical protein
MSTPQLFARVATITTTKCVACTTWQMTWNARPARSTSTRPVSTASTGSMPKASSTRRSAQPRTRRCTTATTCLPPRGRSATPNWRRKTFGKPSRRRAGATSFISTRRTFRSRSTRTSSGTHPANSVKPTTSNWPARFACLTSAAATSCSVTPTIRASASCTPITRFASSKRRG